MSRPLGSGPTPAGRDFSATTGRSAGGRRIGTHCLRCPPRQAPSRGRGGFHPVNGRRCRRSPSHVPSRSRRPGSRRLYAGHRLASTRAPARPNPGRVRGTPGFDAVCIFRRVNSDACRVPRQTLLARLPDPHLTRSRRAFSLTLTTTVFSQRSSGWFDACPRRPASEGHQSSISCSAPHPEMSPTCHLLLRS